MDIKIDAAGFLYVSDCSYNRSVKIDLSGQSVVWLGKNEQAEEKLLHEDGIAEKGVGALEFHNSYGLRLDDDVIYVADKQNFRIQIIRPPLLHLSIH